MGLGELEASCSIFPMPSPSSPSSPAHQELVSSLPLGLGPSGIGGEISVRPLPRWCLTSLAQTSVSQSCPTLCYPMTVTRQAPLSGFSRQQYWSGLPFPPPGDLPDPGIEPGCPALREDALPSEPPGNQIILSFHSSLQICACGLLQGSDTRACACCK